MHYALDIQKETRRDLGWKGRKCRESKWEKWRSGMSGMREEMEAENVFYYLQDLRIVEWESRMGK